MDEKTFESSHSCGGQLGEVLLIVGHHSSPGRPVHPAPAFRRSPLGFQGGHISSGRYTIQWHVHDAGKSARSRGARRGFEAFPFRATRIIDMNVCIDKAGQNGGIAEIRNSGTTTSRITPPSTSTPAARIPSGVTTRRERNACKSI
jgi:hypothetical protein